MKKPVNPALAALREKVQSRKWAGETQQEIAKRLNVTPGFLSSVLHGKKPITAAILEYAGLEKHVTYKRAKK